MTKVTFEVTFSKLKKKQAESLTQALEDELLAELSDLADNFGVKLKSVVNPNITDIPEDDEPVMELDDVDAIAAKQTKEYGGLNFKIDPYQPGVTDSDESKQAQITDAPTVLTGVVDFDGNVTVPLPPGYTLSKV